MSTILELVLVLPRVYTSFLVSNVIQLVGHIMVLSGYVQLVEVYGVAVLPQERVQALDLHTILCNLLHQIRILVRLLRHKRLQYLL